MKHTTVISLFFIVLLFACNSTTKKDDSAALAEDIPVTPSPEKESQTHIIQIRQMKFEPQELKVRKGDKVLWINKDIMNHDVTELSNKEWTSSPLTNGQSWSLVVTQTVDYYCSLHQVMKGSIVVAE